MFGLSGGPLLAVYVGLALMAFGAALALSLPGRSRTAPPRDPRPRDDMPPSLAPMFHHPHPPRRGRGQLYRSTCRGDLRAH